MSVSKILREAKRKAKKFMGGSALNSGQKRKVNNAMETFDELMEDRGTKIKGATKPSAVIGNKRMRRAIERIAENKSNTQTDAVNAILQGTGIGFLIGLDTTLNNKKTTSKTKKTTTTKTPPKPKPNPRRVSKPKPKPNPRIERANRSMIVKPRRNK